MRYRSPDEDSARWDRYVSRPGDVVVSTRSKHGTTWVQAVCAVLVHGRADLPAPLAELSPWLDWLGEPLDDVLARLDAQPHRRVLKTHPPLDGVPMAAEVTWVVVARHPLDAALSLRHQADNLDRARMRELTGVGSDPVPPRRLPEPGEWLRRWIDADADPVRQLDSLPGVLHHLTDAWRRRHEPNVVLVHYDDLLADLDGEMRRLAAVLGVEVADERWGELVAAVGFDAMRADADRWAPDRLGVLRDRTRFFRLGRSGAGRSLLGPDELDRYAARTAALAPADLLAWLHRDRLTAPR